ncbi:MvaI/BcnI family restriction endonuclease [Catenovulum sediminis]|uniref:MvaI/BcnI family restriction endonuclease n=1 Tax=Catenovulum sediminis TaxID=1740262 RepID=UPI00117DD75D|nr:MvaI/BcnI family restriction endonuclease [Catenovulum sediminis]
MELAAVIAALKNEGATRIIVKPLANNDNTKQQVYLGGNFEVIQMLPSGEIYSAGISKKGPIFKAPLDFWWLDNEFNCANAPGAQLILYPKYPEVRFSGFLKKCPTAPSHLMQPPTKDERAERANKSRILFLGIAAKRIIGFTTHWDSAISQEILDQIVEKKLAQIEQEKSVFYDLVNEASGSKSRLLSKLTNIYQMGAVPSQRIKEGNVVPYVAQNGAGFTLESLFAISPNGRAEPDFEDWELKAHSGSVVTLMTPEPNCGEYKESLEQFLRKYGWSKAEGRMDFASIHKNNLKNERTQLSLIMTGYDPKKEEITDPDGGLHLVDDKGNLAAGWGFSKLLEHWKKKHSRTCFVSYKKIDDGDIKFTFGPNVTLAEGASLKRFLQSLYGQAIYYDPGINMKLVNGKWKPKKRNQFRIKFKDIGDLYLIVNDLDLANS